MYNKNEIKILLNEFMNDAKASVILGGHFALTNDPNNTRALIPAIFQDCEDAEAADWMKKSPYMSYFPSETFSMSLDLLKAQHNAKLLLLANDWQQVKETEVSKAELRKSFYSANKLPNLFTHLATEATVNIAERIFDPTTENTYHDSMYWSEMLLRNKFGNRAAYQSCSLKNGCAQEFTPLLDFCESKKQNKMVAMIPATCAYPILDATNEFKNVRDGKMDVMTVFFAHAVSLENFWDVTIFLNGKEMELS